MRNNHFFKTQLLMAALAAAVFAPVLAFSQQKAARTIKDSEIFVPDSVLQPAYNKKDASDMLKECIAAFSDSDMPVSYEVFARNPDKYKRIGAFHLKSNLNNLYSLIHDPDFQEVTGVTSDWIKSLYAKARELEAPAELMDKAISQKSAALYAQAAKGYAGKFDELEKFIRKPDRLDSAALKKLADANKARRKADYIELRKKQILEKEAAEKKALEDELKKAQRQK